MSSLKRDIAIVKLDSYKYFLCFYKNVNIEKFYVFSRNL